MTFNLEAYWDQRYRDGRSSGAGSEGDEGAYKAAFVSDFLHTNNVDSVIDWGVGDGQVFECIEFPARCAYIGIDVSKTVVKHLRRKYRGRAGHFRAFETLADFNNRIGIDRAMLGLSMDVLFHQVSESGYRWYLYNLFTYADRYVMIYSTNYDAEQTARHVKRRKFTDDVSRLYPDWELTLTTDPLYEGAAQFFVYERINHG